MSATYAGSQALLAQRRLELVKLADAHGWRITSLGQHGSPRIDAVRGDAELSIWLSKAGAVLDVNLRTPNGHFTDNGAPIYRSHPGRGRAYAEATLSALSVPTWATEPSVVNHPTESVQ